MSCDDMQRNPVVVFVRLVANVHPWSCWSKGSPFVGVRCNVEDGS